jgi:hypothetical protein
MQAAWRARVRPMAHEHTNLPHGKKAFELLSMKYDQIYALQSRHHTCLNSLYVADSPLSRREPEQMSGGECDRYCTKSMR